MKYALLVYGSAGPRSTGEMAPELAAILARPTVKSWARLYAAETATTLSSTSGGSLLTDGPFIESKEYLGGLIIIEVEDLDEALEVTAEIQQTRTGGSIEVRPIFQDG